MDSFEVWSAMNSDKVLKPSLQIVLAGLKMDSPPAPPRNHIGAVLHEDHSPPKAVKSESDSVAAVLPSSFVVYGDEWDGDSDSDHNDDE